MLYKPFYDPERNYEANLAEGPFGPFSDGMIFQNAGSPKHSFVGQEVFLPFGIAPGPLINGKYCQAALDKGFDIVTYKTVRTKKYAVHPWPNVVPVATEKMLTLTQAENGLTTKDSYSEPIAITNSFGVPSFDPDFWQQDFADTLRYAKTGQVVVGGFQGTTGGTTDAFIQDYALGARLLKEAGANVLEANLSCPNEGTAQLLCFDVDRVRLIAEKIKNQIGNLPLLLKIAYFKDQILLEKFVTTVGPLVDGLCMINTIGAKVFKPDGSQALPGVGRLVSGVCGAPIKWAGIEMVQRVKKLRDENNLSFAIVGVGGVTVPQDYTDYITAGADAVECATGAMWNPYLAQEIKKITNI